MVFGASLKVSVVDVEGSVNFGRLAKAFGHYTQALGYYIFQRIHDKINPTRGVVEIGKLEMVKVVEEGLY